MYHSGTAWLCGSPCSFFSCSACKLCVLASMEGYKATSNIPPIVIKEFELPECPYAQKEGAD